MAEPETPPGGVSPPAARTSAELVAAVIANSQSLTGLEDRVEQALVEACEELSHMEWKALRKSDTSLSTTAGTQKVTLPADFLELLRPVQVVNGASSYTLELWTEEEAERCFPVASEHSNGKPVGCYVAEGALYLVPVPDDSYDLHIRYRMRLLLGTNGLNAGGFEPLVVAYATAQMMEELERGSETATRWWSIFERRVARKRVSERTTGETRRVNVRIGREYDPSRLDPNVVWWR